MPWDGSDDGSPRVERPRRVMARSYPPSQPPRKCRRTAAQTAANSLATVVAWTAVPSWSRPLITTLGADGIDLRASARLPTWAQGALAWTVLIAGVVALLAWLVVNGPPTGDRVAILGTALVALSAAGRTLTLR